MHKERKLVLLEHIPIRWGDMDALGHVNNTIYFRYMEQARVSWFQQIFGELSGSQKEGLVIADASCNFLKPLTYPGTVEVRMLFGAASRSSVESYYEMWMNGVLYAEGAAKIVWIDVERGKTVPLPEAIRALCPGRA
jgi:acyl-CoA thioester hydrolase